MTDDASPIPATESDIGQAMESALAASIGQLFGPDHVTHWQETIAALAAHGLESSWFRASAAVILWLAVLPDAAVAFEALKRAELTHVEIASAASTVILSPDEVRTNPDLFFVASDAPSAVSFVLSHPGIAASAQYLAIREDSAGGSAMDVVFTVGVCRVTAVYGDAPSPLPLVTHRTVSGAALRSMQEAVAAALSSGLAVAVASNCDWRPVGGGERDSPPTVGATGPLLAAG